MAFPQKTLAATYDEYIKLCEPIYGRAGTGNCDTLRTWTSRTEAERNERFNDAKNSSEKAKKLADERATQKPIKCEGTLDQLSSPWVCFWRWAFSWTGAALIWVGVKLAVIAGGIFEVGLRLTIVEFGKLLQTLKPGIDAGWTAMRDIANIIIIGLFVFIAINIILGVKEFGEKKAIAKVLIVAVLINFSLLFTKVIVDASNFTAYQFYNSMVRGMESQSATLAGYEISKSVIAPRFMQLMGVQGIIDSKNKLSKIADSNDNAFYALFYGLLAFIFLIAVTAVFLYGAFLIVSRAIMIVFLMLTSALAFAAWLIPQQYVGSSFKKWWESLLKTAFFAPILIAFLWMTLKVSESLVLSTVLGKEGTLGKLASDASSEANTTALLFFLLVLGLLFASMMTASVFAKGISGFRFAQGALGGTLALGSRFGVAPLLRLGLGVPAYFAGKGLTAAARSKQDLMAKRLAQAEHFGPETTYGKLALSQAEKLKGAAGRRARWAGIAEGLAGRRFNVMDSSAMKAVARASGVGAFAAGESSKGLLEKSIADQIKARTESAEKTAAKLAPSADRNEETRKKSEQEVEQLRKLGARQLEATVNAEKANAEAVKQFQQLPQKLAAAQQNVEVVREAAGEAKTRIASDTRMSAAQQKAQMDAEDRRIKLAEQNVRTIQMGIDAIEQPWKDSQKAFKDYQKETEKIAKNAGKVAVEALGEAGVQIAEKIGQKSGDILSRTIGAPLGINREVGEKTKDLYKKKVRTANLRDVVASIQAETAPASPAAAPRPSTPPPTTP